MTDPDALIPELWSDLRGISHQRLAEAAGMKIALINWSRTYKRRSRDRRDRYTTPQEVIQRWVVLQESGYFNN